MSSDDELGTPRGRWVDRVRALVIGGLGVVPGGGSAAAALVDILWRPALEKRVEEFLTAFASKLDDLEPRVANLETLLMRDVAVSAGIAGTRAAFRAHDREKIGYLANSVARITIDPSWDTRADYGMLLLQLVDDISATHIRVLSWLGGAR